MVRYGNGPNSKYLISVEKQGTTRISVPIGQECFGGCRLDVVLTAPQNSFQLAVPLPTSNLYNPAAPYSLTKTFSIDIDEPTKDLDVQISLQEEIAAPSTTSSFVVSVKQNGSPAPAEVAIFVVDKAVLDLVPHPILDYAGSLAERYLAQYYNMNDDRDSLSYETAYIAVRNILARRLTADPWVTPVWPVHPVGRDDCIDNIDLSDEDYFAQYVVNLLTHVLGSFNLLPFLLVECILVKASVIVQMSSFCHE